MRDQNAEPGGDGSGREAERIIETALFAVARGAGSAQMDGSAIESVRDQFLRKIRRALQNSDWRSAWRREQVYVRAYAEGMGRRAAILAGLDRRRVVTAQDIDAAAIKMRGYMPIAGRWCPL